MEGQRGRGMVSMLEDGESEWRTKEAVEVGR